MDELHVENTGYFLVSDDIFEVKGLSIHAQTVYQVLCRHADSEGKCWPGYARISKMARCSVASVKRAVDELQKTNPPLLGVEHRKKGKQKDTNIYTVRRRNLLGGRVTQNLGVGSVGTEGRVQESLEGRLNEGRLNEGQPAVPAVVQTSEQKRAELEKGFEQAAAAGNLQRMILLGLELMRGAEFSNYPKEQKASARLAEKIKRMCNGQEPRAFLRSLVLAFEDKKALSRAEYWRDAPLTPSALDTRFDETLEHLRKKAADFEAGRQNRELLARLKL